MLKHIVKNKALEALFIHHFSSTKLTLQSTDLKETYLDSLHPFAHSTYLLELFINTTFTMVKLQKIRPRLEQPTAAASPVAMEPHSRLSRLRGKKDHAKDMAKHRVAGIKRFGKTLMRKREDSTVSTIVSILFVPMRSTTHSLKTDRPNEVEVVGESTQHIPHQDDTIDANGQWGLQLVEDVGTGLHVSDQYDEALPNMPIAESKLEIHTWLATILKLHLGTEDVASRFSVVNQDSALNTIDDTTLIEDSHSNTPVAASDVQVMVDAALAENDARWEEKTRAQKAELEDEVRQQKVESGKMIEFWREKFSKAKAETEEVERTRKEEEKTWEKKNTLLKGLISVLGKAWRHKNEEQKKQIDNQEAVNSFLTTQLERRMQDVLVAAVELSNLDASFVRMRVAGEQMTRQANETFQRLTDECDTFRELWVAESNRRKTAEDSYNKLRDKHNAFVKRYNDEQQYLLQLEENNMRLQQVHQEQEEKIRSLEQGGPSNAQTQLQFFSDGAQGSRGNFPFTPPSSTAAQSPFGQPTPTRNEAASVGSRTKSKFDFSMTTDLPQQSAAPSAFTSHDTRTRSSKSLLPIPLRTSTARQGRKPRESADELGPSDLMDGFIPDIR